MKKIKFFSLVAAALFAGSTMAADPVLPTTVYTVGDASTLGSTWASKNQTTNYFVSGDTVIFQSYVCYSSTSNQLWLGYTANGSSSVTWSATECFKGAAAWFGETEGNHKYAGTRSDRAYLFNVTNCVSVLFYGNPGNASRSIIANVYELGADNTVAAEAVAVKTATITGSSAAVGKIEGLDGTKSYQIQVLGNDNSNGQFYEIAFVATPAAKDIATLNSITVNGEELEEFDAATLTYNVELPYGTTEVPVVAATATSSKATVTVTQATAVDGTATIVVTAEDGETTKTYTVSFTVAESQSEDATLASISIDGNAIADFKADVLDYTHTIAYTAAIPLITAEANDAVATVNITQATEVPGTATIVVTAQAGNTQTYTVAISRAAAIKHLTVVPFTNGAKGAINETALTVTAPYMAGEDVPTVDGENIVVSGDGTPTATLNEDGTITLKGADDVEAVYTVVTEGIRPDTLTADEITFTGTEAYIFAPYGWDSSKGWKFAKKVNDETNMRDAKGNTRIYMALPPAESVILTSGTGGARDVKIYVNGAESDVTATAASGKTITITLSQTANNLVAIESGDGNAASGGDGGFTKMQLTNPSNPIGSAVYQAQAEVKAVKVIRNGQLLIIRDGKTYTAQGVQLQ
ncbi:MAG: cadherin-like beta sandwich domain-containing protein [Paludibacteraceae bacterium]